MKNTRCVYIAFLFILYACHLHAQLDGNFAEWGQVFTSDLKINECSFEKDADIILLLDLAKVYYEKQDASFLNSGRFHVTTAYYQRFKVLTENGTKRANFAMRYPSSGHQEITDIKAASYVLEPDGQIKKTVLSPEDIHTRKLSQYENEVSFSIPGVKAGCVFELTHRRGQDVTYELPSWYFSTAEPSLYCHLTIGFLDAIQYYTDTVMPGYHLDIHSQPFVSDIEMPRPSGFGMEKLDGHEVSYTVTNMHSVKAEPYMNSSRNYMDHVNFQLSGYRPPLNASNSLITSFFGFNRYLMGKPLFGTNLNDEGIPKKLIKGLIKDLATPREKAKAIFEFVRQSMQWDGTRGLYAKSDNGKIWKNKTGNSAEINMLLIIALKDAGLDAGPAIEPTRAYGYPNTQYPVLEQFKNLLVYLNLGDEELILDASEKYLPFGLTKYDALDNFIYVIKSESAYAWVKTFNKNTNSENAAIVASIGQDGLIKGDLHIAFDNYTASNFRIAKAANNEKYITEQLKRRIPTANIQSSSDSSNDEKGKFYEDIRFSKQAVSDNDGNLYISLPDIYGQTNNPFVSSTRISDVDFGYKQKTTSTLALSVPDNYVVDSLIPSTEYITGDSSISFTIQTELLQNTLYIMQKLEYRKSFYPVSQYPDFYDFHQKYYKLMQQAVMLKKKK